MLKPIRVGRVFIFFGALLLVFTACLHLFAYPRVVGALAGSGINPLVAEMFKALWVLFSTHLIILSAVLILCSLKVSRVTGAAVISCGLIPVVDATLTMWFIGLFVGNKLLAASGLLILTGGVLLFRYGRARLTTG